MQAPSYRPRPIHWLIALLLILFTALPGNATETPIREAESAITFCAEDDPCWNCETMGNRICGPLMPASSTSAHPTIPVALALFVIGGVITLDAFIRRRRP